MLYCNPSECLMLDEEKCECVKDFECIYEKYCEVDLDLEDCICQMGDGGIWCSALTGDSIKTWEFVYAYDTIMNDTLEKLNYWWHQLWDTPEGLYQYRVDHDYVRYRDDENCISHDPDPYRWEFDDPFQPAKIMYARIINRSSYNIPHEFERRIIKLNPDTLITTWREGEFPGWILLVPNDSINQ